MHEIVPVFAGQSSQTPGSIAEDGQIQLVLKRWQTALLSNDAVQIAPSYAGSVERYFLETHVNRGYVQEYMTAQEERGWRLTSYNLKHVSIEHVSPDEVDVQFVASFDVNTPSGERTGRARTMLKLRQEDGDWKIFSERDYNS